MKRVYFIKPISMDGPIKIGCSKSPDQRIETLAVWCPLPLELIATVSGGMDIERRFHARFLDSHLGHEWFEATCELQALIADIQADRFDIASLPAPVMLRKPRGKAKPQNRDPVAARIINRLGGTTAVARRIGVPITTVQSWKDNGIPKGRRAQIEGLAAA